MKMRIIALLIVALIIECTLGSFDHFDVKAQSATSVIGDINTIATWTNANSPYALIGSITVKKGATLTIEPGVRVYLNNYQLNVIGTLIASGNKSDPIILNDGQIGLGRGSMVENVVATTSTISTDSANILNSSIELIEINGDAIISNSNVGKIEVNFGSPTISKNNITAGIICHGGNLQVFPTITSNNITNPNSLNYSPNGYGIVCTGYAIISDNTISNYQSGIYLTTSADGQSAAPLIERNLIANNDKGIDMNLHLRDTETGGPKILNNTVLNNNIGINLFDPSFQSAYKINYNNIKDNFMWNIYLKTSQAKLSVNASYNWWGKTDELTINRTISYNEVTAGSFYYAPVLTAANPQALPDPNAPIPTPAQTLAPTVSPSSSSPNQSALSSLNPTLRSSQPGAGSSVLFGLDWTEITIIALLGVIAVLVVLMVIFQRERSVK